MQVCLGYQCMYTFSTDSLLCLSTKVDCNQNNCFRSLEVTTVAYYFYPKVQFNYMSHNSDAHSL